jgi:mono/diheme cytochrome c family protein
MWRRVWLVCAAAALSSAAAAAPPQPVFGFGKPATPQEIAGWDIDVRADGAGLPPGRGGVEAGRAIYAQKCAACHGATGVEGPMDALAGGAGTLATAKPVRTVGSFWPYATTLYDFIHRAMPFTQPQSLSPDETYAVTAYVLFLNHIVPKDAVLDARTLPKVRMPNRNGFTSPDPRPDAP